jgi:hypothetical protein
LYEGYPSHFFYGYEKIDGVEEGIKHLLEDGIIKEQEFQAGYEEGETPVYKLRMLSPIMRKRYRLTAEGLRLVESWGIEKLTKWVMGLTISLVIIGILQLILIYLQKPTF